MNKRIKKTVLSLLTIITVASLTACGNNRTASSQPQKNEQKQDNRFPEFTGTDFDGNKVDHSLFSKNEVTLLNFWFNGCSACVNEMPELEKLNEKLRKKGAELIGVNIEAGSNEKSLEEAKEILKKQGVTYKNLYISGEQKALDYIGNIFAFPTTIIIDKNGNIIGDPITGSIEDKEKTDAILQLVDDVKNGKEVTSPILSEEAEDKQLAELGKEQNNIFSEHPELWNKVFESIQKDNAKQMEDVTYAEFLKTQIDSNKASFTEDELKLLYEDIKKIDDIDKKAQALTGRQ